VLYLLRQRAPDQILPSKGEAPEREKKVMAAQIPIEFQHLVRYEPTYSVLICCPCKMAVGKRGWSRHLRARHTISKNERKLLLTALDPVCAIESEDRFPQPADVQEPIRGLEIYNAYKCNGCDFITKNDQMIRRHIRKSHGESLFLGSKMEWRAVKVQQWVATGKAAKYWIVGTGLEVASLSLPLTSTDYQEPLKGLSWEDRMERTEMVRLSKQDRDRIVMTDAKDVDDTTPWLLRTKWPQIFGGKSLRLIGRTRYSELDPQTRTMFPDWTDRRTKLIGFEFDRVVMRARSTLILTSDSLRLWLQSSRRNEPSRRPFRTLQRRGTDRKYGLTWKQFLYYCLRVFGLDSETREEQYGVVFTGEQLRCLAEVNELIDEVLLEREGEELEEDVEEMDEDDFPYQSDDEDEDESEAQDQNASRCYDSTNMIHNTVTLTSADRLTEKVFELCIKFLTQTFRHSEDESKAPLVHFCGVLGIDWKQSRFRDPGNYTPHLAGIMWISRLLLLEYALPMERYSTLDWPAREYYQDHRWQLEWVRREFMLEGCPTPLGYMVSLMAYGKYTAKQLGRMGVITWDADGQGLQIKDTRVTMAGFKTYIRGIISEARDIMNKELLFGVGEMRLDLVNMRDVMTEKKNGFSMIDMEINRLGGGLRYLLNLVKSASPEKTLLKGAEEWRRDRVLRYLERKKRY